MPASICLSIDQTDTNTISHLYREHMPDRIVGRERRNTALGSQDGPYLLMEEDTWDESWIDGGDGHKMEAMQGDTDIHQRLWRNYHQKENTCRAVFPNSLFNSLFNSEYPDNSACLSPSRTASLSTRLSSKVRIQNPSSRRIYSWRKRHRQEAGLSRCLYDP